MYYEAKKDCFGLDAAAGAGGSPDKFFNAQLRRPAQEDAVDLPIIMYHEVKPAKAGKDAILPSEFEQDLQYLASQGYTTVTISQVIDYVNGNGSLPQKPIMLTFDDGYLNNYTYVLPLLQKYNAKIVFSVIGKCLDDFTANPCSTAEYAYITWSQLTEMMDTGLVEVQNHTYNLHAYNPRRRIGCTQAYGESDWDYEALLTKDIGGLQTLIAQKTGQTPDAFAYPYGKRSDLTDPVLKKLGFEATLTCDYGISAVSQSPECLFGLKRIGRPHGQSLEVTLREGFKTLKYR
ncbi:hypothetical protein SDC9_78567 [bioreactor metagenome]|uniref:NodB homology domain-containing protein n=1 Tax=bioreactor metagenome TaxID=1076179 RepID=A0A644YUK8_9ZZZZ